MSKSILEQALAHLLNQEEDQAGALLHDYYVGIGRKVYEDIMADDISFEDEDTTDLSGSIDEVDADLTEEGDDEFAPEMGDEADAAGDLAAELGDQEGEAVDADAGDVADAMMDVESALAKLKAERNPKEVEAALSALTEAAKTGKGNLLELAIKAARVRCSLGEISYALELVFGRYKANIRSIAGVYSKEISMDKHFLKAKELADTFAELDGRRPRIMIAKMGQDGHDRGAKVIATGFADLGFDVDIGPLFQTPEEVALQAAENDVHVIGASSLAAGHKTLIPQLIDSLKKIGRPDIKVVAGGVIPPQDYDFLYRIGVMGIFGPGTPVSESAKKILVNLLGE